MRMLKLDPGAPARIIDIPNTLQALQAEVGGYIETITLRGGIVLIVNEEGRLNGMPANRLWLEGWEVLHGPILICSARGDSFGPVGVYAERNIDFILPPVEEKEERIEIEAETERTC